eukprot:TRINITY_DN13214_c0_g2_i1.p1 TRINITY_DN13214_c0_g2~~TRINITY_DN13214_c0_g2_i1.p1  ORF type:complete len:524 (-),score=80.70 TRINITY_DN13214_c0_g2_i1:113-1684(-)
MWTTLVPADANSFAMLVVFAGASLLLAVFLAKWLAPARSPSNSVEGDSSKTGRDQAAKDALPKSKPDLPKANQERPLIKEKPKISGPALPNDRELWLLRTLATTAFMNQMAAATKTQVATDSSDQIKRRIWLFLHNRPNIVASGCGDGQARLFSLTTGEKLVSVRHDICDREPIASMRLTPGPVLYTGTWDGKRHDWTEWPQKPARPTEFARGETGISHGNMITGIESSRDGTHLACSCSTGRILIFRYHCPVKEIELTDQDDIFDLRNALKLGDHSEFYLPKSIELAGGAIRLEENDQLLPELAAEGMTSRKHLDKVEAPAKFRLRFVGCMTAGSKKAWRKLEHGEAALCLTLSPEGSDEFLYSGSRDKTVCKWRMSDGELIHTYRGHKSMVKCITANTSFLASGSDDRTVRIWRKDEPQEIRCISAHSDFVRAISLCQTFMSRLVSSGEDGKVLLWDVETGQQLREYAHCGIVSSLDLSGSILVTAGEDKMLRVWHTEAQELQHSLRHPGRVSSLALLRMC